MNPNPRRRSRVAAILDSLGTTALITRPIRQRAVEVRTMGFGDMDALHIATAESAGCDYLLTCDDDILERYEKRRDRVRIAVTGPIAFLEGIDR